MITRKMIVALSQFPKQKQVLEVLSSLFAIDFFEGKEVPSDYSIQRDIDLEVLMFLQQYLTKLEIKQKNDLTFLRIKKAEITVNKDALDFAELMKVETGLFYNSKQSTKKALKGLEVIINTYGQNVAQAVLYWAIKHKFWRTVITGPKSFVKNFSKMYIQAKIDFEENKKKTIYEI